MPSLTRLQTTLPDDAGQPHVTSADESCARGVSVSWLALRDDFRPWLLTVAGTEAPWPLRLQLCGGLRREHLLQALQNVRDRFRVEPSQGLREPFRVDRPKLIERDESGLVLEPTRGTPWIRSTACRHWGDDDGTQMIVEFVGGTRPHTVGSS
jgi:hypothetical protein